MKKQFENLAKNLMIQLTELELERLVNEFPEIEEILKPLEKVDTKEIKAMRYPLENAYSELTKDEVEKESFNQDVLSNSKKVKDNLVVVKRVVL